ncbi:MAG: TetR family transcriptional regulator [Anaerolineaceae bacterium]|nr:TetR family transcriptional regulator [Anaerolineaceae bacterium]
MKRTKEEAAVTRENLLQAGLVVFGRKGYDAATLEDVAREAGVTRGAIYWHFGSKTELFNALMEKYSSRGGLILQQGASEGGTFTQILTRVFARMLKAVETDQELHSMMEISLFKSGYSDPKEDWRMRQVESNRSLIQGIADTMKQGIEAGALRKDLDPVLAARAFLAFQNGIIYLWLSDPSAFSLGISADAFAEVYLRGVQA